MQKRIKMQQIDTKKQVYVKFQEKSQVEQGQEPFVQLLERKRLPKKAEELWKKPEKLEGFKPQLILIGEGLFQKRNIKDLKART